MQDVASSPTTTSHHSMETPLSQNDQESSRHLEHLEITKLDNVFEALPDVPIDNSFHAAVGEDNGPQLEPCFRESHDYFPKEIYYSATPQQAKDYRAKYLGEGDGSDVSNSDRSHRFLGNTTSAMDTEKSITETPSIGAGELETKLKDQEESLKKAFKKELRVQETTLDKKFKKELEEQEQSLEEKFKNELQRQLAKHQLTLDSRIE
ncbi:hypothetical protein BG011_004477 [Mortierella polycephala]|uniref:Uncharacterized protein n=1 Tax=Mortierella polycephala TaxID=41804 RepID=A0A9P6PYD7_9FUNG|nr:hypothetical protein BG011_004477 [Mortierella polycephala]